MFAAEELIVIFRYADGAVGITGWGLTLFFAIFFAIVTRD
jgi:hypothetical protein